MKVNKKIIICFYTIEDKHVIYQIISIIFDKLYYALNKAIFDNKTFFNQISTNVVNYDKY